MQALSMMFVERACRYLNSQMAHLGDAVLANLSKQQGSVRRSLPDHQNIRHRTRLLHPLLQVYIFYVSSLGVFPTLHHAGPGTQLMCELSISIPLDWRGLLAMFADVAWAADFGCLA